MSIPQQTLGISPTQLLTALAVVAFCFLFPVAPEAQAAEVITISQYGGTLQQAIDQAGEGGMVIVDETLFLDQPIVLPRRFRMVGLGHQGQGTLAFTMSSGSAISIQPGGDAWVSIENLDIEGLFTPGGEFDTTLRALDLSGSHNVYLRNLTIRGFDVGVYGDVSFSVHALNCSVSVNRTYNYYLYNEAHSWRITGGLSSQAGRIAIRVRQSNNTVIDSVRLESNPISIYTDTVSTHVINNRFECSPVIPQFCAGNPIAVRIGNGAVDTLLVGNLYAGLEPVDDLSVDGRTYRFDQGYTALVQPRSGEDGLRVALPEDGSEMVFDDNGRLRVGSAQGVSAKFTVNADSGEAMRVRAGGVTRLFVGGSGNVGVGTASPSERLEVNGNIRLNGDILSDGEICIGSGC